MRLEVRAGEDLALVAQHPLPGAVSGTGDDVRGAADRPVSCAAGKDDALAVCDYLCWPYAPEAVRHPAGTSEWGAREPRWAVLAWAEHGGARRRGLVDGPFASRAA